MESLLTRLEHQGADSRSPLAQAELKSADATESTQENSQPGTGTGTAPESSRSQEPLQSNPDRTGQPTDRKMESMSPAVLSQRYGISLRLLITMGGPKHLSLQLVTHGSNTDNIYQHSSVPTIDLTELGGNRGNPNNSGHTPYLRSQLDTRPPGKLPDDLFRHAKYKLPVMSSDMTGTWDQYRVKLFNFIGTYGLTPENIANAPTPEIWFDRDQKLYQILTQAAENAQDKLYVITAPNLHKSGTQAWYRLNELFAESSVRGKVQILQRLQTVLQSPLVPAAGESFFEVCNGYFYQIINLCFSQHQNQTYPSRPSRVQGNRISTGCHIRRSWPVPIIIHTWLQACPSDPGSGFWHRTMLWIKISHSSHDCSSPMEGRLACFFETRQARLYVDGASYFVGGTQSSKLAHNGDGVFQLVPAGFMLFTQLNP